MFAALFGAKANIQGQLRALGIPYAVFYTGPFADYIWASYVLSYFWLLTTGPKVLRPRRHEREGVRW